MEGLVHAATNLNVGSPSLLAAVENKALAQTMTVEPNWILEGSPTFTSQAHFETPRGETVSGIWICEGPGKFHWRHDVDESLYVLEGGAEVEYQGTTRTLAPGDIAIFEAGTWTKWHVESRIRKTFTLRSPSRMTRLLRRIL